MIPLLADEDVPRPVIEKLRGRGVDILSVDEEMKEATDREVFSAAQERGRTLLTYDSDYRTVAEESESHHGILLVTQRAPHDRVVDTLYSDYIRELDEEDIRNALIHVPP